MRHVRDAQTCAMRSPPAEMRLKSSADGLADVEAVILIEPLKFIVNSRLPIGTPRLQHYMSDSTGGMRFAAGMMVPRRGGKLPGVRHHSNLETRKGD